MPANRTTSHAGRKKGLLKQVKDFWFRFGWKKLVLLNVNEMELEMRLFCQLPFSALNRIVEPPPLPQSQHVLRLSSSV